jgi:hypothetical protein
MDNLANDNVYLESIKNYAVIEHCFDLPRFSLILQ